MGTQRHARVMRVLLAAALLALAAPIADAARATLRAARPGGTPLVLEARSTDAEWIIRVTEAGAETQVITVETDLPERRPFLADADGDRAADLWVPVIGGNASTAWDLWVMQPDQARFRRAGEISGVGFSRDQAGRLVALGREGCCTVSMLFHRIGADGVLSEVFSVNRRLDDYGPQRCTGNAIAEPAPPAVVRAACALEAGRMPGVRLGPP
ncbi:hypothetical protein [Roseomonas fluvialis]|nr:hypothetical protein [Roseomonas fluvialis]